MDLDLGKTRPSVRMLYSKNINTYRNHIGYDDNDEIMPLIRRLPQMTGRYNIFKDGKTTNFRYDDNKLLKNTKKYLKILVNDYGIHIKSKVDEARTYFHRNKAPNKIANYRCSAQI